MERIGIAFAGGGLAPSELVECVQLAEELGYESAWVAEGHGGDQFSILTACALATNRILLGTSISSVFVRSAPTIAMAAASVDHFSGGRFILGLGTSHQVQVEGEHGLQFSRPVQRMRECIDIIRALTRDGEVSYQGSVFNIDRFDFRFGPVGREIPIYLAAVFPRMIETCGEIAQGVLLIWCTVEHARAAVEHIALGARRVGRAPEGVDVAAMLNCAVSSDAVEARDSIRDVVITYAARFPRYRRLMAESGFAEEIEAVCRAWNKGDREEATKLVPHGLIDRMALAGTPDEYRQRLEDYRKVGINLPIIMPRIAGTDAKKGVTDLIRACAPQQ